MKLGAWLAAGLGVFLIDLVLMPWIDPYWKSIVLYAGINVILAVSLNLVTGFTGQFSMGHAGFMAVGAYTSALTGLALQGLGSFALIPALLAGTAAAGLSGYLVGLPSLRLKGDYLAIVTLGFGEIIRVILLNVDAIGGARGLPGIPPLSGFGSVYGVVVITLFFAWRLVHCEYGREMLAVREDEIAASACGVDTTRAKVRTFAASAALAGTAGGLFAHTLQYLNPSIFDFNRSFEVIIMVVLGGLGSITGSVLAAMGLTFLREGLRPLQEITGLDLRMVLYSGILIGFMLLRPKGLLGTVELPDLLKRPRSAR